MVVLEPLKFTVGIIHVHVDVHVNVLEHVHVDVHVNVLEHVHVDV